MDSVPTVKCLGLATYSFEDRQVSSVVFRSHTQYYGNVVMAWKTQRRDAMHLPLTIVVSYTTRLYLCLPFSMKLPLQKLMWLISRLSLWRFLLQYSGPASRRSGQSRPLSRWNTGRAKGMEYNSLFFRLVIPCCTVNDYYYTRENTLLIHWFVPFYHYSIPTRVSSRSIATISSNKLMVTIYHSHWHWLPLSRVVVRIKTIDFWSNIPVYHVVLVTVGNNITHTYDKTHIAYTTHTLRVLTRYRGNLLD
jgi:hypothetical protein